MAQASAENPASIYLFLRYLQPCKPQVPRHLSLPAPRADGPKSDVFHSGAVVAFASPSYARKGQRRRLIDGQGKQPCLPEPTASTSPRLEHPRRGRYSRIGPWLSRARKSKQNAQIVSMAFPRRISAPPMCLYSLHLKRSSSLARLPCLEPLRKPHHAPSLHVVFFAKADARASKSVAFAVEPQRDAKANYCVYLSETVLLYCYFWPRFSPAARVSESSCASPRQQTLTRGAAQSGGSQYKPALATASHIAGT